MSVNAMIARQTRIERQEAAHCASVSFERHAANAFQSYVRDALAFSIKRGGILYGCGASTETESRLGNCLYVFCFVCSGPLVVHTLTLRARLLG